MLLISSMSSTAIAVAFPEITSSFNTSIVLAGWVLSASLLATLTTAPLMGRASDSFGRKNTFIFFVLLFVAGSFFSAIAQNIYWLIIARLVQGIGGGGFVPAATGIVAEAFPKYRQRSVGFIISIMTAGTVLGPNLGGWLTESFGWRSIFWFALPWTIVILVGVIFLMKKDPRRESIKIDVTGAAVFALSLGGIMVGITMVGDGGKSTLWWIPGMSLAIVGAALLGLFIWYERRLEQPLIDVHLLGGKSFLAANVFNTIIGLSHAVTTFIPYYAVTIYGMSTLQSGLAVTPRSVGLLLSSLVTSFFLVRWGYRKPMLYGSAMLFVTSLLLGFAALEEIPYIGHIELSMLLVIVGLSGIGMGITVPAANNACIELMPQSISTITGLRQTFRNLGGVLGVAVTTIVLHNIGDDNGFAVIFVGSALLFLLGLPAIFSMPRSACDV